MPSTSFLCKWWCFSVLPSAKLVSKHTSFVPPFSKSPWRLLVLRLLRLGLLWVPTNFVPPSLYRWAFLHTPGNFHSFWFPAALHSDSNLMFHIVAMTLHYLLLKTVPISRWLYMELYKSLASCVEGILHHLRPVMALSSAILVPYFRVRNSQQPPFGVVSDLKL